MQYVEIWIATFFNCFGIDILHTYSPEGPGYPTGGVGGAHGGRQGRKDGH